MPDEQGQGPGGEAQDPAAEGEPRQPTEEELRAYEEQIRKLKVSDLVLQSTVSILNLTARRIAKEDERDLAQAKVGIDAARALTELVPEAAQPQLRQAVSELQMLYAQHAGEGGEGDEPKKGKEPGGGDSPLWTPGG